MKKLGENQRVGLAAQQARQDYQQANPAAQPPLREFKLTFPDAVAAFVTQEYEKAGAILEYGSGGSTVLAAKLGKQVVTVESDRAWATALRDNLDRRGFSAVVHYSDIGPTREWGYPADNSRWQHYAAYPLSVWDLEGFAHPDLVLIDGRMRIACLATTALRITQPVRVLFDDYARRKHYHVVERFFPVAERTDRMAVFDLVPGMLPIERMHEIIPWFFDLR